MTYERARQMRLAFNAEVEKLRKMHPKDPRRWHQGNRPRKLEAEEVLYLEWLAEQRAAGVKLGYPWEPLPPSKADLFADL